MYNLENADFLKYYRLIQSIPNSWKQQLKENRTIQENAEVTLLQRFQKLKQANKFLYNKQFNDVKNKITIKPHTKWEEVHTIPFKSLISTKIRAFQYRYLMRIIPNNQFLYKCNINSTSLCDFCTMYVETNKHLFWECHFTREFWTDVERFLNEKEITIKLDYKLISIGYTKWSSHSNLLNFILIYAKYFIFKNKYSKTIPMFSIF